jgi:hypothetical protein
VIPSCSATIQKLNFGSFHLHDVRVNILPSLGVDGLLGMNVLHRMKINQQEDVMFISSGSEEKPKSGPAQINDVNAVPLTDAGRSSYKEFLAHPGPRLFMICADGTFSSTYGSETYVENMVKQREAGCEPYVINDAVVWKGK